MAGPQDIQRYPRALIDLLGMRATGDTPHRLAQELVPTLDQTDYYLFDRQEGIGFTVPVAPVATGTVTFGTTAVVPQNEIWMLWDYTVTIPVVAAASSMTATPGLYRGAAGITNFVALAPPMTAPALAGACVGVHYEKPNMLGPGQQFALQISGLTGVPGVQPFMVAWFSRLRG